MDREGLEELFAPFAAVSVRRMFSGHGVYFDGLCFALSIGGDVYLKVDAETQADFAAVDSRPFVYAARGREVQVGYWLAPSARLRRRGRTAAMGLAGRRGGAARRGGTHGQSKENPHSADQGGEAIGPVRRRRPRWKLAVTTPTATLSLASHQRLKPASAVAATSATTSVAAIAAGAEPVARKA